MSRAEIYDCIVIGAGPAGLTAALFLARYRRRVLTFHHNSPRNVYAHGIHGFLGHHGIPPAELLARGRDEVTLHGGLVIDACVTAAEQPGPEHFRVICGDDPRDHPRSYDARRLVLATGLRDQTPDCPGFRDFYGYTVHHCPDCDGYEVTGQRVAVLGNGHATAGFALNLLTWTDRITLITNGAAGDMIASDRATLSRLNIPVIEQEVECLYGDVETRRLRGARLKNGSHIECDALFFNLGTEPSSNLYAMLGCRLDEECGLVWVGEDQQTSVEGVYAAGDLTPRSQLAVVAAAEGAMAAIHLHKSLIPASHRI